MRHFFLIGIGFFSLCSLELNGTAIKNNTVSKKEQDKVSFSSVVVVNFYRKPSSPNVRDLYCNNQNKDHHIIQMPEEYSQSHGLETTYFSRIEHSGPGSFGRFFLNRIVSLARVICCGKTKKE